MVVLVPSALGDSAHRAVGAEAAIGRANGEVAETEGAQKRVDGIGQVYSSALFNPLAHFWIGGEKIADRLTAVVGEQTAQVGRIAVLEREPCPIQLLRWRRPPGSVQIQRELKLGPQQFLHRPLALVDPTRLVIENSHPAGARVQPVDSSFKEDLRLLAIARNSHLPPSLGSLWTAEVKLRTHRGKPIERKAAMVLLKKPAGHRHRAIPAQLPQEWMAHAPTLLNGKRRLVQGILDDFCRNLFDRPIQQPGCSKLGEEDLHHLVPERA